METPVVFIIFKRPDTTAKVFEAIRQAKPSKLFVIADGPRAGYTNEAEKCKAARAIIEQVDWKCEVIKKYSQTNLGCAISVSSGLNWVFEQVEEAIILEDDCIPHPTFFPFCEELLEKYRHDTRIASISGQNVQFGQQRTKYSYYFSRYNHCWGWATWKRAWQHYDINMKLWKDIKTENFLKNILFDSRSLDYWTKIFQSAYEHPTSITWDYQWTFACWIQNSLGIISNVNLISNIGFGLDSTHFTSNTKNKHNNLPMQAMHFPLKHPPFIIRHIQADDFTQRTLFIESKFEILKHTVKKILKV